MLPLPSLTRGGRARLTPALFALLSLTALAQQAPSSPSAPTAAAEPEAKASPLTKENVENKDGTTLAKSDEPITLSPFEVRADARGYQATNTMSGTRLNSKLEDIAASITVITKQQILDTAAVDLNDLFSNEGNTEGIYQFTDFVNDRGNIVDNVSQAPERANRVRGLGQANLATNGFASSRAIPVDSYNLDSVEISRGPNSNLFGLGEPSGTINLIRGRANLARDISQTSIRVDDRGSHRVTLDLNRVLFKDKLAVRLAAVHDQTEFVRKPSRDDTNRLTASLSYRPFQNTTIRASYESYHNFNSRANSTTPRDTITEWRANGSPVWDPTFGGTGGWRLLNGTTYTSVTSAQEATLLPRGILPNGTGFWNRPSLFVMPDGTVARYEVNRAGNAVVSPAIPTPGAANSNIRYAQLGTLIQRGGGAFGSVLTPLFVQPGVTDQSIYDWEEINYAAPNFQRKRADIYQAEIEQWIIKGQRHQLAFQGGVMREDIMNNQRSFIGASDGAPAVIQVDINEKLLDGTANPYYLRPYIGGSEMQTYKRPEFNDQYKGTLAYQLDLSQEKGLVKWLGRHNFAAYYEFRSSQFAPQGLRYRDQIVSTEPWMTGTALTNIPGRGAENRFYTRYYMGGAIGATGPVITTAPSAPLSLYGPQTMIYYNGATRLTEAVDVNEAYFALGTQKNEIRSRGIIWQGYLFNNRVIPTIGWRRDKNRTVNNVTVPLRADGFLDESYLDIYQTNWFESAGPTKTKGVVVVPFAGWNWLDRRAATSGFWDTIRSLRFHYNESDSFQPAPLARNLFGEALPDPKGNGKDYGFSFSALDGKVYVRVNRYNTELMNDRNGATAVLGTRPMRLDFDLSGDSAVFGATGTDPFDLEDNVYSWLTQINPSLLTNQAEAERQVYSMMGLTKAYVDSLKNQTIADVNNTQSKGTEIELYYNPTRNWTIKGTFTDQQAIDTSISPTIQRYLDARMPTWTTIRIPTTLLPNGSQLPNAGQLWWTTLPVGASGGTTGTNVPVNFYTVNIDAPYKLAVTNSGKPRPQTRRYRWNMTTNYRFSSWGDMGWLKNLSVGGTVRWEDRAIVGFLGGTPDADGAVRRLDGNKPIYDKARTYADLMVGYNTKLFNGKISTRFQLNVRNVMESGRLQAVAYNPDGTPWNFRIIDPRQFILTTTFDF
jgi:outer membrane receptor for ferric coprogen and ferric-rhodotorulic acid